MRDTAGLGRKSGLWGEMCQTLIIIQAGKSEKSHSCPKPNIQRWTAGSQNTPARGPWSCNSRLLEGQETFRNWGVGERHFLISVSNSKGVSFSLKIRKKKGPPRGKKQWLPPLPLALSVVHTWKQWLSQSVHENYLQSLSKPAGPPPEGVWLSRSG